MEIFPIETGDFLASHVGFQGGYVFLLPHDMRPFYVKQGNAKRQRRNGIIFQKYVWLNQPIPPN